MSNENWNPGHSPNKGYPYNGAESKKLFKNRPDIGVAEDGKTYISVDKEIFPDAPEFPISLNEVDSFLLHRMYDYKKALEIAEDQIDTLMEERPFIPERLGFELIHNNASPLDGPPMRIYASKFTDGVSLYRKPGNFDEKEWNPATYIIILNNDGVMKEIEVLLPCERIAYALIYALGIQMTDPGHEANVGPIREEAPVKEIADDTTEQTGPDKV